MHLELTDPIFSDDENGQLDAIRKLQKFSVEERISFEQLFESGVLDRVYEIIDNSNSDLSFEATMFLAKFGYSSGSRGRFNGFVLSRLMEIHKCGYYGDNACLAFLDFTSQAIEWDVNFLMNKYCLEFVVSLLTYQDQSVGEKALIALGNSVVDITPLNASIYHNEYRDLDIFLRDLDDNAIGSRLLVLDAMQHLENFYRDVDSTDKLLLSRAVSQILFCICRLWPMPPVEIIPLAVLFRLLNHSDATVVQNACLSLSHIPISEGDISPEIIDRLGVLLKDGSPFIVIPALRIVAHAVVQVSKDPSKLNRLYDCTFKILIDILERINEGYVVTEQLDDKEKEIVCHIIGSFCHTGLIKKLSEDKVMVGVVKMIRNMSECEVKNFNKDDLIHEAATTIKMFWDSALPLDDKLLVGKQCIEALCHLLVCPAERVLRTCLKGLAKILKDVEKASVMTCLRHVGFVNFFGRDKIENLVTTHPNYGVQCLASQLFDP